MGTSDSGHRDKHGNTHAENGDDEITHSLLPEAYPQLYGTDGNKPSADIDGRTYWSDDQHVLWLDTGSSWQKMAVADHADLDGISEDAHHEAFTPTDHDDRDHSAVSDTVRLDEWEPPTNVLDINDQNLDDVASIDGGGDAVLFDDILDLNSNDLEDDSTTIWDTSEGYIPQEVLESDTVTVAGNDVSLGGSTDIDGADLIGSEGSSGQVLQTDGSNASWTTISTSDVNSLVYNGKLKIDSTGTETISGLPFEPNHIVFRAELPVSDYDASDSGDTIDTTSNFAGTMTGYAFLEDGTTYEQASSSGMQGITITYDGKKYVRYASSSSNCIYMEYGGEDGSKIGEVAASLSNWNSDGFDLDVETFDIDDDAVVVHYTAYRTEDLSTEATDVSDDGSLVAGSVGDINFSTNLSVQDDGDGTVTIDSTDTTYSAGDGLDLSSETFSVEPSEVRLDEWAAPTNALDINDQALNDVSSIDGDGDAVLFDDIIDLNSNDLEDDGVTIWDTSEGYIPQERLEDDTVTVADNDVSLGGSTSIDHGDLSNIGTNDHIDNLTDIPTRDHNDLSSISHNDHHGVGTGIIWDGSDDIAHDSASVHEDGGDLEINVDGLSGNLADAQDPKSHASTHFDGGGDELDAADLAGAEGSSGEVLTTDGSACSWSSYPEFVAYEPGITEWGDGLDDEEVHRMNLQSGETFELDRIELRLKGGGTDSDVSLDVYDNDDDNVIDSVTAGNTSTTGGSSGSGNLIQFRISNSTGGTVNAVPIVRGRIV